VVQIPDLARLSQ